MALIFENLLLLNTLLTKPHLLDFFDEIKTEISAWPGTSITIHRYGGIQFNCAGRELGHIHGNGLLDMRFSRKEKEYLMAEGRITHHHFFKTSGWVSFYIRRIEDKCYAIDLLYRAYLKNRIIN